MGELVLRISTATAVIGSLALSFLFVASLYFWKLCGYEDADRNEVGTIQRRFLSTTLSCVCSAALVCGLAEPAGHAEEGLTFPELLGFQAAGSGLASAFCLLLTASLFTGPIVQHLVATAEAGTPLVTTPEEPWAALRDDVVAPFTEEFVFRACLVRLCVAASLPTSQVIFCSPLCFALAHAHHFVDHVRRLDNKQLALAHVAFQLFYTSLFGVYSTFLLLRTGSTVAVILAHSFCNHQGFPDLGFLVSRSHLLYPHRAWLGVMYVMGILAFCWLIVPLTEGFASTFVPMASHEPL